jgi:hypothetical protein
MRKGLSRATCPKSATHGKSEKEAERPLDVDSWGFMTTKNQIHWLPNTVLLNLSKPFLVCYHALLLTHRFCKRVNGALGLT